MPNLQGPQELPVLGARLWVRREAQVPPEGPHRFAAHRK